MIDISPNFGVQTFESEELAVEYLRNLGFKLILRRSDYDVYETEEASHKKATLYENKEGRWVIGQHVES
jgi:hypothetical protein